MKKSNLFFSSFSNIVENEMISLFLSYFWIRTGVLPLRFQFEIDFFS